MIRYDRSAGWSRLLLDFKFSIFSVSIVVLSHFDYYFCQLEKMLYYVKINKLQYYIIN